MAQDQTQPPVSRDQIDAQGTPVTPGQDDQLTNDGYPQPTVHHTAPAPSPVQHNPSTPAPTAGGATTGNQNIPAQTSAPAPTVQTAPAPAAHVDFSTAATHTVEHVTGQLSAIATTHVAYPIQMLNLPVQISEGAAFGWIIAALLFGFGLGRFTRLFLYGIAILFVVILGYAGFDLFVQMHATPTVH